MVLLCLTISCSKEKVDFDNEFDQKGNNVGLEIKDIEPLPADLYKYTAHIAGKVKYLDSSPNIDESVIVNYYDFPVQAIYTPLSQKNISSLEVFHVYFELEGLVSKFDMLISEERLNESEMRYTYRTTEGDLIVLFDVDLNNGLIINVQQSNIKSWKSRFENCVSWTFGNMSSWDYLACMALGPICAGTIGSMCAFAATENMFQTPEGP